MKTAVMGAGVVDCYDGGMLARRSADAVRNDPLELGPFHGLGQTPSRGPIVKPNHPAGGTRKNREVPSRP